MTANTHNIVKHIFKSDSLKDVSVGQLKELSVQYPFFSVSHYLLSKKLYSQKEENFLDEAKIASLYFNNPFWMQWLLENSSDEKLEAKQIASVEENKKVLTMTQQPKQDAVVIENKIEEKKLPTDNNDELVFQPYHTVDYFASQGIKLSVEEIPADKFGKQLKSFTDWLKTMKKLPQKEVEGSNVETAQQAAIEGFAAHSIQQKEVLTEAMAEVLAKQGRNADAMSLYKKLSLLNPSKNAYFAAKIEQLNSH